MTDINDLIKHIDRYDRACRRAGKGGFLLVCRTPRFRADGGEGEAGSE